MARCLDDGYIHYTESGGMVGGQAARSESFYFSPGGLVQASHESTDGVLMALREGHVETEPLFDWVADHWEALKAAPEPEPADPGMATEYYPPTTEVCLSGDSPPGFCRDYETLPDVFAELIRVGSSLLDQADLPESQPGVYARVRPLRAEDLDFVTIDHRFNPQTLDRHSELRAVFDFPFRLIRLSAGVLNDPALKELFLPGRFSHVELNGIVHILYVYELELS